MAIAYFDCLSGISGDMILGAIIDAGLPLDDLKSELTGLGLSGYRLSAAKVKKAGMSGTQVVVESTEQPTERHLSEILSIIEESRLDSPVKEQSSTIFRRLAAAEAKVHGQEPESVHFHEVGAIDAIVDVVGAVAGLRRLGIERIYSSSLPLGRGWIQSAHGKLPVPAPATAELVKEVPTYAGDMEAELVTPTGAAILTTLCQDFGPMPPMTVAKIGYGAGSRDLSQPNLLRIFVGSPSAVCETVPERITVLETNIDDMNPEFYDHLMDRLLSQGALDAYLTPIYMKKNRPATMVTVLAPAQHREELLTILFQETTTLGVRIWETERRCLARETREVETQFGKVRVKIGRLGDRITTIAPEYEDCRRLALEHQVPLKEVYQEAERRTRE